MRERDIFIEALELGNPAERAALLDEACQSDSELRGRVERLLAEHERQESFILDTPPSGLDATVDQPISEGPGTVIGPYKLLQQIGEGGMGIVFMAEQSHPVQRTVALKIIKPGMDTRQVIARFEAERQALALMDHPNIARVIDAGTTAEKGDGSLLSEAPCGPFRQKTPVPFFGGRPYFVMDLVKGVPITDYCDQQHLTIRQRLELFTQVCHAVQHAHQKGIIHRDLKPSNVLVAEYDGKPVPKIIDFGVAKATAQRLTERTMFTEYGQLIGTMEYMSPEQSKFNQLDVDTRSDIYSLGVLLYELLAGSTPFEGKRLHAAAFDEMLRIIREEEPLTPSTKLSSSDTLPSIAANRHTEPTRLSKDVRGDLDWIVMKALEKDRARRYDSAANFAADIDRHLHDKPVDAGPPTAGYRFRKFARRHKGSLAIGTLILIFLAVLGGGAGWVARDRAARQARFSGQLEVILNDVARLQRDEKWAEALATARRAEPALATDEAAPLIQHRMRQTLADLEFVERLEEIRAQSPAVYGDIEGSLIPVAQRTDRDYAIAFQQAGIDVDQLAPAEAAKRIIARHEVAAAVLPVLDDWIAVRSRIKKEAEIRRLADVLRAADPDPWRQQVRDCLTRRDWPALEILARSPDLDRQPAATLSFLCAALRANNKHAIETDVLRRAQWKYPADYWINHRLGLSLIWNQSLDPIREGIGYMHAAVAIRPDSAHAIMNLGNGYAFMKEHDQAIACYQRAIELKPDYWVCHGNLGISLGRKGRYDQAIAALEKSIQLEPKRATEAYAELSMIHSCRPEIGLRSPHQARALAEKAVEFEPQASDHWTTLGIARYRENQWDEAVSALDKSQQLDAQNSSHVRWHEAINLFFLAMSYWQLAQQDQARLHYDRAVQSLGTGTMASTDDDLLLRIRAEAEELLNLAKETNLK